MRDGGFWLRTRWTLLTWLCGAALLTPPQVRAEDVARVDLIGSWFVLIHYRDSATANPDSDRWKDRVWTFEMKGSRLHWTDHPIVVFGDTSGRFEARGGNRRARVLAAWQPNEAQRQEIQAGLRVNSRGAKTKSLRGSFESGWESVGTGFKSLVKNLPLDTCNSTARWILHWIPIRITVQQLPVKPFGWVFL